MKIIEKRYVLSIVLSLSIVFSSCQLQKTNEDHIISNDDNSISTQTTDQFQTSVSIRAGNETVDGNSRIDILNIKTAQDQLIFFFEASRDMYMDISFYYDYQQVQFSIDDKNTYSSNQSLQIKKDESITFPFFLSDDISTDQFSHSLVLILVIGADQHTSQKDIASFTSHSSDAYRYQINYPESAQLYTPDFTTISPENTTELKGSGLYLNTDFDNQSEKEGLVLFPELNYIISPDEKFNLRYYVGIPENVLKNTTDKVNAVFLITGKYEQLKINNSSFVVIETEPSDYIRYGDIELSIPNEPGQYEILGYLFINPFETDEIGLDTIPIGKSIRFTITVE